MVFPKELIDIRHVILTERDLGKALRLLRNYADVHSKSSCGTMLDQLETDYQLMCDFMLRGYSDEKRAELYDELLRKAFCVTQDIGISVMTYQPMGSYVDAHATAGAMLNKPLEERRALLERFVQDVAMLSLDDSSDTEATLRQLYSSHLKDLNAMFTAILVGGQWSESEAGFYTDLLLSPTIDINDACVLTGAIMISTLNVTDINKLHVLQQVYLQSTDTTLRQRALVGWALSLPKEDMQLFPKCKNMVKEICSDERAVRELLELQMQIFYCMDADKDHETIKRDIIPTLMKNNNLRFTKNGIEEKEEDPMQDILNPDESDKAMEELEESIQRMAEMQKAGSDIYFGGFSQMKRFPFFYTLSNWFTPFYIEHPGLNDVAGKLKDNRFLSMLMEHGPFCDSDKYSFALAMSSIIDRMPENLREMMNSREVYMEGMQSDTHTDAYRRRMYLQDLYRFFRLFQQRSDFINPFDAGNYTAALFFVNKTLACEELAEKAGELERFLLKRKHYGILKLVLRTYKADNRPEYHLYKALAAMHDGNYDLAETEFRMVLTMQPENLRALKGLAQSCFYLRHYEEAAEHYSKLNLIQPERTSYLLNMSIALIFAGRVDEGVKNLYKLEYENEDNDDMKRALAWGLLYQNNGEQAQKIYQKLLAADSPTAEDLLNAGYCEWSLGHVLEAVNLFQRYADAQDTESKNPVELLKTAFAADEKLLEINGISEVEQKIMIDLCV